MAAKMERTIADNVLMKKKKSFTSSVYIITLYVST